MFQKPRFKEIIEYVCKKNSLDFVEVVRDLNVAYPELWNKERCANCDASMAMYEFKLDVLDLLLVQGMGRIVRERMSKGISFTEANKIHLQTELNDYYSVPSRSTQCAKLGLIAKVLNDDGTHDSQSGWLLTRRGFACLRDEPVPKSVVSFRNKIVDRTSEMTTMSQIYEDYNKRYEDKKKEGEYSSEIRKHNPKDWFTVVDYFPNGFT